VARVFSEAKAHFGELDFVLHSIAFAPIDDLRCPFVMSSREAAAFGPRLCQPFVDKDDLSGPLISAIVGGRA